MADTNQNRSEEKKNSKAIIIIIILLLLIIVLGLVAVIVYLLGHNNNSPQDNAASTEPTRQVQESGRIVLDQQSAQEIFRLVSGALQSSFDVHGQRGDEEGDQVEQEVSRYILQLEVNKMGVADEPAMRAEACQLFQNIQEQEGAQSTDKGQYEGPPDQGKA